MYYVLFNKPLMLGIEEKEELTYGFTFDPEADLLDVSAYVKYICSSVFWEQHGNVYNRENWISESGDVYGYYSPLIQEYAQHAVEKLGVSAYIYKTDEEEPNFELHGCFVTNKRHYHQILLKGKNSGWCFGDLL